MTTTIEHSEAVVRVQEIGPECRRIVVEMKDPARFSPRRQWQTRYPLRLIEAVLQVTGPAFLCDEIARDEDPSYVQSDLDASLLSYVARQDLDGKRFLDFGCGSGASSMVIARMFPRCRIVGVELCEKTLTTARLRAEYYGLNNVTFLPSPSPGILPEQVGEVDYILLCGVYEHLLPAERPSLLLQMWEHLAPGGVLFITETSDRRFPIETHTTGLPLLNYRPDRVALWFTHRFSKRDPRTASWDELLRRGIRGATPGEIVRILSRSSFPPALLRPRANGIRRQSDIWYHSARTRFSQRYRGARRTVMLAMMTLAALSGVPVAPYLSLAVKKCSETTRLKQR